MTTLQKEQERKTIAKILWRKNALPGGRLSKGNLKLIDDNKNNHPAICVTHSVGYSFQ